VPVNAVAACTAKLSSVPDCVKLTPVAELLPPFPNAKKLPVAGDVFLSPQI
jgi:hypothetical protein